MKCKTQRYETGIGFGGGRQCLIHPYGDGIKPKDARSTNRMPWAGAAKPAVAFRGGGQGDRIARRGISEFAFQGNDLGSIWRGIA